MQTQSISVRGEVLLLLVSFGTMIYSAYRPLTGGRTDTDPTVKIGAAGGSRRNPSVAVPWLEKSYRYKMLHLVQNMFPSQMAARSDSHAQDLFVINTLLCYCILTNWH